MRSPAWWNLKLIAGSRGMVVVHYSIEHLNGPSLAVFPQMIFGTFRPKIVLITTPNFEVSQWEAGMARSCPWVLIDELTLCPD